jgi:hypothetical protein
MNSKQLLLAFLILGIIGNVYDTLFHGVMLGPTYATIFDFIGAFLFVWVYSRVTSSFEKNPMGGVMYGFLVGILVTIPGMLYEAVMYKGFPLWLSFAWIAGFIIKFVIYGVVLGMLVRPKKATA